MQISARGLFMQTGYLWNIGLGVLWGSVGVVVALARKQQCPIWSFYTLGALLAALFSLPFCPLTANGITLLGILILAAGALCAALGQAMTMYNLRGQARAVLFSIQQMNFVFTYILSLLFLNEKITFCSGLGIILLFGAITGTGMLGSTAADRSLPDLRRLLIGVAASALCGCGQFAFLAAGNNYLSEVHPGVKGLLTLIFCAFSYALDVSVERKELQKNWRQVLRYGILWGILAGLSYRVLFETIDRMNEIGRSGLVYPIGCSVCILTFYLYSAIRLRDKISWRQMLMIAGIITGVVLLRF